MLASLKPQKLSHILENLCFNLELQQLEVKLEKEWFLDYIKGLQTK